MICILVLLYCEKVEAVGGQGVRQIGSSLDKRLVREMEKVRRQAVKYSCHHGPYSPYSSYNPYALTFPAQTSIHISNPLRAKHPL